MSICRIRAATRRERSAAFFQHPLRKRRETGFTLLEVLVATVILGTAVAALFGLLSGALRNADRLQAPEQALLLGQAKMNELLAVGADPSSAAALPLEEKVEGRWGEQFRWEALATRLGSSPQRVPGETTLVRIALDVFWKSGTGEERKFSLETCQLRPEPGRVGP
ncbi:MAG: prepilin-type N-terminal cleavage/methylation domain-containing protein [Acidobacteria bacterium]|nr:prepilin-type N-terminal cleavage/methylation domain-containing protein [Acidobacteriota bacterium]